MVCCKCSATDKETKLFRCPICHKMICEDCTTRRSNSHFCSRSCADFFFFGDEDDQD